MVSLAQALGIAYAAGLNLYATVALVGLIDRLGLAGPLPGGLHVLSNAWVIGLALLLFAFEFTATLIPGVASAWETFHSLVRPPAASALAVLTAWHGDALLVVIAALLGGGLGLTTHATKLGLRYAIDTSPEPVTNGVANVAELGFLASFLYAIWHYPYVSLAIALVLLALLVVAVRAIWRALREVFSGRWMPSRGLLQEPRASARASPPREDE